MAHGSIDDLATLSELDENSLMEELQTRYKKDIIYVIEPCLHFLILLMLMLQFLQFLHVVLQCLDGLLLNTGIFTDSISVGGNAIASVHPSVRLFYSIVETDCSLTLNFCPQGIEGQGHRSR